MAILTKPSVSKGTAATFTLSKEELALVQSVVANEYFSDPANWKKISIAYETPVGKQREIVVFDATQAEDVVSGQFLVSEKARDEFLLRKITIEDFDGGFYEIMRSEVNAEDFDVVFSMIASLFGSGFAWGNNSNGILGDGTTTTRSAPVNVLNVSNFVAISTSQGTGAIDSDGNGYLWGTSTYYSYGNFYNKSSPFLIIGSDNSDFKDVKVSGASAHYLKSNGEVWSIGQNDYSQLGDGTSTSRTSIVKALESDFVQIAANTYHVIGLKSDGTVWGWGYNVNGQLGLINSIVGTPTQIPNISNVKKITTGGAFSLALTSSGALWASGLNNNNQFGDTSSSRSSFALVSTAPSFVDVFAGDGTNSFGIASDGTLWVAGNNPFGSLGTGDTTTKSSFTQIVGHSNFKKVASSTQFFTVALKSDGTVWSCGYGSGGRLGLNSETDYSTFQQVAVTGAFDIDVESNTTVGLKSN